MSASESPWAAVSVSVGAVVSPPVHVVAGPVMTTWPTFALRPRNVETPVPLKDTVVALVNAAAPA